MQAEKKDIKSLLPEEVSSVLADLGEPAFRAKQVYKWLRGPIGSFEDMKNIPKALRERLGEEYYIYTPRVLRKQVSKLDGTTKYLWELRDGNAVETVIMRYKHGNTVCVSSQVGCRMGCRFCASTIGGLGRNLLPGEIIRFIVDLGISKPCITTDFYGDAIRKYFLVYPITDYINSSIK